MIIKSLNINSYFTLEKDFFTYAGTFSNDQERDYFIRQIFGQDYKCPLSQLDDLKLLLFMGLEKHYQKANDVAIDPIEKEDDYYIPDCWVEKFNSEGLDIEGNIMNLFLH